MRTSEGLCMLDVLVLKPERPERDDFVPEGGTVTIWLEER